MKDFEEFEHAGVLVSELADVVVDNEVDDLDHADRHFPRVSVGEQFLHEFEQLLDGGVLRAFEEELPQDVDSPHLQVTQTAQLGDEELLDLLGADDLAAYDHLE